MHISYSVSKEADITWIQNKLKGPIRHSRRSRTWRFKDGTWIQIQLRARKTNNHQAQHHITSRSSSNQIREQAQIYIYLSEYKGNHQIRLPIDVKAPSVGLLVEAPQKIKINLPKSLELCFCTNKFRASKSSWVQSANSQGNQSNCRTMHSTPTLLFFIILAFLFSFLEPLQRKGSG